MRNCLRRSSVIATAMLSACCALSSQAISQVTIGKANNSNDLNLTTSWTGGVAPGALDTALWNSTVTGANTVSLGLNLSWGGIQLTNPGGAVTINGFDSLTLGTGGIDMSTATQNLTINSGLILNGGQTWNVATGATLTTSAFSRSGFGTTLVYDRSVNTGTITASPTLTNGIVGPWAIVRNAGVAANGSADGYTFATVNAGDLSAYTGATSQTLTTAWGGIPSGGSGSVNYDISSTAALLGATGLNRNVNTLRYTGGGARQAGNNAGDLLTINGLMNSGTGAFVIGRDAGNVANDFSFGILIGDSGELVLAPMTADLTLHSFIKNNGVTPGNVTVVGNNELRLTSANTYTGATRVNGGTLHVSGSARGAGSGSMNGTSGITIDGANAKYLHTSTTAGTAAISLTRGTVDGSGTIGGVTVADNATNLVANGNLTGSGTLTVGSLAFGGDATMNLRLGAGVGVNVTGALSTTPANGTVTVNATKTGWVIGSNNLVGFGSFSGSVSDFALGTVTGLGSRQVLGGGLAISGNFLTLNVAGDLPVWTGTSGSAWTTAATGDNTGPNNWATKTGLTATNFWTLDTPEFNDTYNIGGGPVAVTNRNVDIQGADVTPGVVTFNNSAGDYLLFSSTGHGITGGANIVKSGSSKLVVTNNNTYTGDTTINGGTLQIGDGTTDGSIATSSGITNNGTLAYNLTSAQTYANVISGTGSVSKEGAGNLTLSGNNTYQGGTSITAGAVTLIGNGTLGTGNVSVGTGSTLNINRNYTTSVAVTGGGDIVNTGSHTITGDFTGFSGTYTHNATTVSTALNSVNSTSENAAYVIASAQGSSQGIVAGLSGDHTLKLGSLSGVANSLLRGGNVATGTTTFEIGNLNTNTVFAGSINNGATKVVALTKVGTGSLILDGAVNTYSGATAVNRGKLVVNGTISSSSSYTVAAGAALGGTGRLGTSDVNILAKAFLTPGNDLGTLAIDQSLNMAGIYEWQIKSTSMADVVTVGGNLTISGQLSINLLPDLDVERSDKFTLLAYQGSFSGAFSNRLNGWLVNYEDKLPGLNAIAQAGPWKYVTLTALEGRRERLSGGVEGYSAVPEPSALLLLSIPLGVLVRRRRV